MSRKLILTALASAAVLCGSQALALGPGGGGGGHGGGAGGPPSGAGGMGNMGGFGRGGPGDMGNAGGVGMGVMTRDDARINSQGPDNASATGIAHANANSVLAGTTPTNRVTAGPLSGVTTGMTVLSNGMAVGTVAQIRTARNGSVVLVLVKGTNGGLFPVPANKLTLSGRTLVTSARFNGINDANTIGLATRTQARMNSQGPAHASATGISHANANSVLAGASAGTSLSGVATGMPVFSNGTRIGAVTRVVTNGQGAIVRVLVQGTSGRTFSLSPSSLSLSGGTITTTATLRGL